MCNNLILLLLLYVNFFRYIFDCEYLVVFSLFVVEWIS